MKTGFYKSKNYDRIYYIYKNEAEDSNDYPYLVSTFEYESMVDGLKRYEDESGNDVALQFLEDTYEEKPLRFKFTTIANENDAIIEDKLSNSKKLKQLKKILQQEIINAKINYTKVDDEYRCGYHSGKGALAQELLDFIGD